MSRQTRRDLRDAKREYKEAKSDLKTTKTSYKQAEKREFRLLKSKTDAESGTWGRNKRQDGRLLAKN